MRGARKRACVRCGLGSNRGNSGVGKSARAAPAVREDETKIANAEAGILRGVAPACLFALEDLFRSEKFFSASAAAQSIRG